jgi:hypothetical protein
VDRHAGGKRLMVPEVDHAHADLLHFHRWTMGRNSQSPVCSDRSSSLFRFSDPFMMAQLAVSGQAIRRLEETIT